MEGARAWMLLGVSLVLIACSGDSAAPPETSATASAPVVATLPLAEPSGGSNTGSAVELAPSQISASTVAPPDTPGPCAIDDLEFWTAQVVASERSVDAIIRVRNTADVWCEPDISGSRLIDPEIEPDVWLDPGGWADLVVGQSGEGCDDPRVVALAEIDVDGQQVTVPTAAIAACGWRLTAFIPNDVADQPCAAADLETAQVPGFLLMRNAAFQPCVIGDLVSVDAEGADQKPRGAAAGPALRDLAAGDVVGWPMSAVVMCDRVSTGAVLRFEVAEPVTIGEVPCRFEIEVGAARPWYGAPGGPLGEMTEEPVVVGAAVAALNPFPSG